MSTKNVCYILLQWYSGDNLNPADWKKKPRRREVRPPTPKVTSHTPNTSFYNLD